MRNLGMVTAGFALLVGLGVASAVSAQQSLPLDLKGGTTAFELDGELYVVNQSAGWIVIDGVLYDVATSSPIEFTYRPEPKPEPMIIDGKVIPPEVAELLRSMDDATTVDEFVSGAVAWGQEYLPEAKVATPATVLTEPPALPVAATDGEVSPAKAFYSALTDHSVLEIGDTAAPTLHMVLDPRCPYCAKAFQALNPYLEAGKFHLRIIPAVTKGDNKTTPVDESSLAAWVHILSKENASQALADYEMKYGAAVQSDATIDAIPLERLTAFSKGIEFTGTPENAQVIQGLPFFAYEAADGEIKLQQGLDPSNTDAAIDKILSQIAQ